MNFPALSLTHHRMFMERSVGPMQKLIQSLAGNPEKLAEVRADVDALALPYYAENVVHQGYIPTRAKRADQLTVSLSTQQSTDMEVPLPRL